MATHSVPVKLLKLNRIVLPDENTPHIDNLHATVNTSGRDGRNGQPGVDGRASGAPGTPGQDGEHATHAHPIFVTLYVDKAARIHLSQATSATSSHSATLPLSDPRTSIFLCARGGHGGHGGKGGAGAPGAPGKKGGDATAAADAGAGEPGAPGGHGGSGGSGGAAGNAASVVLNVDPRDTDLLLLLKRPPPVYGGTAGAGAEGGAGGKGGKGGRGGKGCSYTVGSGDAKKSMRRAPGKDGASGKRGRDGAPGGSGAPGQAASFSIKVGNEAYYPWRYDLNACDDVSVTDWLDCGVIEPGTRCAIHYSVHNCGAMPTPELQDVLLSAQVTRWIQPVAAPGDVLRDLATAENGRRYERVIRGSVALPRRIQPGAIVAPAEPFHVSVARVVTPAAGSPLLLQTKVLHKATLTRVNQDFPLISDLATVLTVSYPLIMTPAVGHVCVLPGRESVITWRVRNVSAKPIGLHTNESRLASTRLELRAEGRVDAPDARGRTLRDVELAMGYNASAVCPAEFVSFGAPGAYNDGTVYVPAQPPPPRIEITLVQPGQEIAVTRLVSVARRPTPSVTGAVTPGSAPPEHSVVCLNTHLDLGHPVRPQALDEIQARPFQVQVACPFEYHPSVSQTLLIVNDRTTAEELRQWRELSSTLSGTPSQKVSVWNLSLYGGFSFRYRAGGDECLGRLFSGGFRNVVLLNNPCTPGGVRTGAPEQTPLQHLGCDELLDAVKSFGCNVYVAGSHQGVSLKASARVYGKEMDMIELEDEKALKDVAPSLIFPHKWERAGSGSGEESAKPASGVRSAAANADMKGFLHKKKEKGTGKVSRYFVVRKAQGTLAYYDNVASKTAKATFELAKCKLLEAKEEILVETPDRVLVLSSPGNPSTLEQWRAFLKDAIAQAKTPAIENVKLTDSEFDEESPPGAKVCCFTKVVKMTGKDEKSFKAHAGKLAKELASTYPETPFITVYKHFGKEQREKASGTFSSTAVGEIFVYGGIELHGGRVIMDVLHGKAKSSVTDGTVDDPQNLYGCLKSLSFERKVELLNGALPDGRLRPGTGSGTHALGLSVLVDAVLSDVAEEVTMFSYGTEKMGSMLRSLTGRSDATQMWLKRMKFVDALLAEKVLGRVSFPSAKYDQCLRLGVTLKVISNVVAPFKMGNFGRRGAVAQALIDVVERIRSALGAARGHSEKAEQMTSVEGVSFEKIEKEWSKSGVVLGQEKNVVKPKELLEKLRTYQGVFQPGVEMSNGGHGPAVMSWAELERLREGMAARSGLPTIRGEPGEMGSDAERMAAMEQMVRGYEVVKEHVEPIEV